MSAPTRKGVVAFLITYDPSKRSRSYFHPEAPENEGVAEMTACAEHRRLTHLARSDGPFRAFLSKVTLAP